MSDLSCAQSFLEQATWHHKEMMTTTDRDEVDYHRQKIRYYGSIAYAYMANHKELFKAESSMQRYVHQGKVSGNG